MVNCLPFEGARGFEAGEILGQRLVIRIVCVGLDGGDDGCRADEAGDVVDVAVGVVSGDAAVEPEHLIDAEVVVKGLFQLLAADAGVALLDLAEQTLLGGEQRALRRWCRSSRLRGRSGAGRRRSRLQAATAADAKGLLHGRGSGHRDASQSYLAQALKCQLVRAISPFALRTKMGPESRVQTRSVGHAMKKDPIEIGAGALENAGGAVSRPWSSRRGCERSRVRRGGERFRRRPRGWAEICRASLHDCAARRARWPRAAPTRQACGSRGLGVSVQANLRALLFWISIWGPGMNGIEKALGDGRVGVDAAVAQEGPVAARVFKEREIDFAEEDFFRIVRGLGDDAAEGIGQKAAAPELEAGALGAIAEDVAILMTDAIDAGHVDAVGDGVRALDGLPCVVLRGAELVLLGRMPADGRGIEKDFCALQGGEARAFGIPLIPADERADAAEGGVDGAKSEIAGREVVLLVVERIVGDVHLAIDAGDAPIGVEGDGGVVVEARGAALKERGNDDDASFAGDLAEFRGRGSWDGLGEIEEAEVFALAEVLSAKKLGEADDVCAETRGLANVADGRGEVGLGIGPHSHLDQSNLVAALFDHEQQSSFQGMKQQGQPRGRSWPEKVVRPYTSRIRTAAAMVVVQSPRLSPTADCVMLLVRTILLEMR